MSIRTSSADGVFTIEIARPEKKNALTVAMQHQQQADDDTHEQAGGGDRFSFHGKGRKG
jgi:hypothetical protein